MEYSGAAKDHSKSLTAGETPIPVSLVDECNFLMDGLDNFISSLTPLNALSRGEKDAIVNPIGENVTSFVIPWFKVKERIKTSWKTCIKNLKLTDPLCTEVHHWTVAKEGTCKFRPDDNEKLHELKIYYRQKMFPHFLQRPPDDEKEEKEFFFQNWVHLLNRLMENLITTYNEFEMETTAEVIEYSTRWKESAFALQLIWETAIATNNSETEIPRKCYYLDNDVRQHIGRSGPSIEQVTRYTTDKKLQETTIETNVGASKNVPDGSYEKSKDSNNSYICILGEVKHEEKHDKESQTDAVENDTSKIENLRKDKTLLMQQVDHFTAQNVKLERDLNIVKEDFDELQNSSKDDIERLKRDVSDYKETNENLLFAVHEKGHTILEQERIIQEGKEKIQALEITNLALNDEYHKLKKEKDKLKLNYEHQIAQIKHHHRTEIEKLTNEHKSEVSQLKQRGEERQRYVEQLKSDNVKLKQENTELQDSKAKLLNSLSSVMNQQMARDESDLENINVKNRPMKIMEEYHLFCSQEWLDAKTAIDDWVDETGQDEVFEEKDTCSFVCDAMLACYKFASTLHFTAFGVFADVLYDPLGQNILQKVPPIQVSGHNLSVACTSIHKEEKRKLDVDFQVQIAKYYRDCCDNLNFKEIAEVLSSQHLKAHFGIEDDATIMNNRNIVRFYTNCLVMTWKMCVQQPAMSFKCEPQVGGKFDDENHELHFGSADPTKPNAVIHYYVLPGLFHGKQQMKKARIVLHIHDPKKREENKTKANIGNSCDIDVQNGSSVTLNSAGMEEDNETMPPNQRDTVEDRKFTAKQTLVDTNKSYTTRQVLQTTNGSIERDIDTKQREVETNQVVLQKNHSHQSHGNQQHGEDEVLPDNVNNTNAVVDYSASQQQMPVNDKPGSRENEVESQMPLNNPSSLREPRRSDENNSEMTREDNFNATHQCLPDGMSQTYDASVTKSHPELASTDNKYTSATANSGLHMSVVDSNTVHLSDSEPNVSNQQVLPSLDQYHQNPGNVQCDKGEVLPDNVNNTNSAVDHSLAQHQMPMNGKPSNLFQFNSSTYGDETKMSMNNPSSLKVSQGSDKYNGAIGKEDHFNATQQYLPDTRRQACDPGIKTNNPELAGSDNKRTSASVDSAPPISEADANTGHLPDIESNVATHRILPVAEQFHNIRGQRHEENQILQENVKSPVTSEHHLTSRQHIPANHQPSSDMPSGNSDCNETPTREPQFNASRQSLREDTGQTCDTDVMTNNPDFSNPDNNFRSKMEQHMNTIDPSKEPLPESDSDMETDEQGATASNIESGDQQVLGYTPPYTSSPNHQVMDHQPI